jgi:hypothetical protein
VGRVPSGRELKVLADLLASQRAGFETDAGAAKQLVPAGIRQAADLKETAAWTAVARVLLNLDEFITRE